MTSISDSVGKTAHTIGIRIENVPQLVPVEKARKTLTTNTSIGTNICTEAAEDETIRCIKSEAPSRDVTPP